MTPYDLQVKGMKVLVRELGYEHAMRFMLQFRGGKGDYTKERKSMLKDLTMDDLLTQSRAIMRKAVKQGRKRSRSA